MKLFLQNEKIDHFVWLNVINMTITINIIFARSQAYKNKCGAIFGGCKSYAYEEKEKFAICNQQNLSFRETDLCMVALKPEKGTYNTKLKFYSIKQHISTWIIGKMSG